MKERNERIVEKFDNLDTFSLGDSGKYNYLFKNESIRILCNGGDSEYVFENIISLQRINNLYFSGE